MRHKYETRGIVLSRLPLGEANAFVTLLTPELGLIRARAQGVRRSGAKLAGALTTFAESDVVIVRVRESWRIAGAVLVEIWFARLGFAEPRERAGRISSLLLRLVAGETHDSKLFSIINGFFNILPSLSNDLQEAAEILAALRILAVLGFDKGGISENVSAFTRPLLAEILRDRTRYISRINHGIEASGL